MTPAQTPAELAEAAIKAAERNAERQITTGEGREPPVEADPFRPYDEAKLAEDVAAAKAAGCTVEQVQGARGCGMSIQEYVAWGTVHSAEDAVRVEADAAAEREARKQIEHEALVAKVREKLR